MAKYAAQQTVDQGIAIIRLIDFANAIEVSSVPSIGNRAYEMRVHGQNILYYPYQNAAGLRDSEHLNGIPFLAPWANRMAGGGFHANGRTYTFNMSLDSIRLDGYGMPIHGLLTSSPFWEVTGMGADESSAYVTSRLQFWRHPDLMANWPFAHEYTMTYRLAGGVLEVKVSVISRSTDPMPIAVGFHPYFQLPGVPIQESVAHIAARKHVQTDSRLLATGATSPIDLPDAVTMKDLRFDDGFSDLVRGPDGCAVFYIEGHGMKIEVAFGPRYQAAIVYAPPKQNYICFEPMSAITNGINLAFEGKYGDLQTVQPGGQWRESFWVRPSGF
jgi:aldose 1-epimerase